MIWINICDKVLPPKHRTLICYCPDWCASQYQIAYFDGNKFCYDEQPNDDFNVYVTQWALLLEAD